MFSDLNPSDLYGYSQQDDEKKNLSEEQKSMPESQRLIVDAARDVFQRKGFDGARMQDIADAAGMNKALLHYYFRNKDLLFEAVFREALEKLLNPVFEVLGSPKHLEWKIGILINRYTEGLMANPHIPGFVLHELNRNPQRLQSFIQSQNIGAMKNFLDQLEQGMREGRYRKTDPRQVMVHLISMIVFPFVARPMIQTIFMMDDESYVEFIQDRQQAVVDSFYDLLEIEP
jgi:AcrR family transcriptional regulator